MELSFARFEYQNNLTQQRELFRDCFPETEGDAIQSNEHYFWKFQSYPYSIHSWEYFAYVGKEMVGYYAAIPYRYKIGNRITAVGMVCDVMTSSRQRGKGIFTKMGRYSTEELSALVPFTTGYPIRKEVIPGHLKVGWKVAFTLPLYIKFLSFNAFLKTKRLGFISPFVNIFLRIYNTIVKTKINRNYSYTIFSDIEKVVGYESFALEWGNTVENSLVKDLSFVRWRYSAPRRKYKFLSIYNQDKMIGFLTLRSIIKEGVPSYCILDYMVLPGFDDCHGLINEVLSNNAKNEKLDAIMTMMSKTSASNYRLLKNGYLKSPFTFSLIIKNLTGEFNDLYLMNEKLWHLMWVDSDDL